MRVGVAFLDVMHVVRRHQLQTELLRPENQVAIDFGLLWNAVVLQLQIKIIRTESLLEPIERLAGFGQLIFDDQFRNFTGQAAGEGDQSFFVRDEQFFVDARFVIIAFEMGGGGQLDEIAIADFVLRQEDQVIVNVAPAAGGLFLQPAAWGHVHFAANDRFDPLLPGRLIKVDCAIQNAVIGKCKRRELQFVGLVHQPIQAACAIEQ